MIDQFASTSRFMRFIALLLLTTPVLAQVTAPAFTTDGPFAITSSTYTNTVAGTTINGNVCFTTPPAVTPVVTGTFGACPAGAATDQTSATSTLLAATPCTPIIGPLESLVVGANPPGVLPPGCYSSPGAINITANGIVTLNGNGVFVFRSTGGAITSGANSQILLAGGACAGNVFWTAAGATTLGGASTFVGSILDAAGVTLGLGAALQGRALAFGGTVTTNGANTITVPAACAALAPPTVTLTKVSNGGVGSFTFTGTNGLAPQTITTVTSGVPVAGAPQSLAAASTITSITEGAPAGGLGLASISCTGTAPGGTATVNLATRTVTFDATATAAGSAITCTFTNSLGAVANAAIPTLSEWSMIILASLLAFVGFVAIRRKR